MAMEKQKCIFSKWLKEKLIKCDIDEAVFAPFLIGILEDDTSDNKKTEDICEILTGMCTVNYVYFSVLNVEDQYTYKNKFQLCIKELELELINSSCVVRV